MNPCFIDHIVITAPTLEMGAELVSQVLVGGEAQKRRRTPSNGDA